MKKDRDLFRWIYPLLLGIVLFNTLRAITDFNRNGTFWTGSLQEHITAQAVTIAIAYAFDCFCRRKLKKEITGTGKEKSAAADYLTVACLTTLSLNALLFAGTSIGLLELNNGWIDYMLIDIVYIPLLLIYYATIRTTRMNREYEEQRLMVETIRSEQLRTELNYLRAQYHPHFLFNALNTIYFQIDESNGEARKGVELLSELLRYQIYSADQKVTVEQEVAFMKAYIDFQKLRMPERLQVETRFDRPLPEQTMYSLLFQPLLENAFKYVDGAYRIAVELTFSEESVVLRIENSVSPEGGKVKRTGNGVGIKNLRRRLELLYPQRHALHLERNGDRFTAELKIELQ
ncbi:MAG: histidine kinase [Bacteroidales bacterium]|nr:histidine kinase [Bacteroidales bacterium]